MIAIVTSADIGYIPGVKALYHSYVANSYYTDIDFFVLAHGSRSPFRTLNKNIQVIFDEETVNSPTSKDWPIPIPAMYSRLLIPRLFKEYEKVLWLDADTIVLKDLGELLNTDMSHFPCAGCLPGTPSNPLTDYMPVQFEEPENFPEYKDVKAIQAGVVLFNPKDWAERGLDTELDRLLLSDIKFRFVVQGYLGYVLKGNFIELDKTWNCYSNWIKAGHIQLSEVKILHFVGGRGRTPWSTNSIPYSDIWRQYL